MQNIRLEGPLETQHDPFISQMEEQTHVIKNEVPLYMLTWKDKNKIFAKWNKQAEGHQVEHKPVLPQKGTTANAIQRWGTYAKLPEAPWAVVSLHVKQG